MKNAPPLKIPRFNNVQNNSSCLVWVRKGKHRLTVQENAESLSVEGDGKRRKTDFYLFKSAVGSILLGAAGQMRAM
jgi:hypothetical protein